MKPGINQLNPPPISAIQRLNKCMELIKQKESYSSYPFPPLTIKTCSTQMMDIKSTKNREERVQRHLTTSKLKLLFFLF